MTTATHNQQMHQQAQQVKAQGGLHHGHGAAAPEPKRLSQQQIARNKNDLDAAIRANGNMSVARRTAVVAGPLESLGYSQQDADAIALDAPLNTAMSDQQALLVSLRYAQSISQPVQQNEAPDLNQLIQPTVIPMPKKAQLALQSQEAQDQPVNNVKNKATNTGKNVWTKIANAIKPATNKIGNLPSPGGVGGLFFINLLFLAAVVPANAQGYTRLQLIWYTLLNRTAMPSQAQPTIVPASPFIQAAFGGVKALEDLAISVGTVGQDAQNVISAVQGPGQSVLAGIKATNPVIGGILGGLTSGTNTSNSSGGGPGSGSATPPGNSSTVPPPPKPTVTPPPPPSS